MPLDHYVSQVYLRNFYSPALGDLMHAFRKEDHKKFPCRAQDVCRIADGSTNKYLTDERAIEDFLREIEPRYNESVEKLRKNEIDQDAIAVVAGFVAYVITCSPAAMRLHIEPLQRLLEAEAEILEQQGLLPESPPELGNKPLTELLATGAAIFTVDGKYPQALGISSIGHHVSVFGNSTWEILRNDESEGPFFTSDYPVCIEPKSMNEPIDRVIPLAPDIAVRIIPNLEMQGAPQDHTFSRFKSTQHKLRGNEVRILNRLIVRCAEELVFYRDERDWVERFCQKNSRFRVQPITERIPYGTGFLNWSTLKVQKA